jgi:predicted O-methyltransferase YrrM
VTSPGTLAPSGALSASRLLREFEGRRQIPSDIQDHLLTLYTWARGWQFAHILELGVRTGNSTAAFLAALEVDRRGHLWSVDFNPPDVPEHWHELDTWSFLKAHSLSAKAADWAPREIDVLFLDTEHDYRQVRGELDLWVPRVRPGGVVLVHDTDAPELSGPGCALTDYCAEHGLEWQNNAGCHGLGIMRIH